MTAPSLDVMIGFKCLDLVQFQHSIPNAPWLIVVFERTKRDFAVIGLITPEALFHRNIGVRGRNSGDGLSGARLLFALSMLASEPSSARRCRRRPRHPAGQQGFGDRRDASAFAAWPTRGRLANRR